jgi:hypothetical protein
MRRKVVHEGPNRYREFLSAAKIIAGKISRIEGVVGILGTGGIGRGYCDDYSDLDLIVYVDHGKVREMDKCIAVGWLRYKEIDLDTPVESYQKALTQKSPSRFWSQVMRWDRQNSQLLFDTDDRIANLLKEKLVFPDWEQRKLLATYRENVDEHLNYNFKLWEMRGRVINLADSLIRAVEHIILWMYAKNKKFQPYIPKWLFYHLENNPIPEAKYFSVLKKAYLGPITTVTQARKVRNELIGLCKKVGIELKYEDLEALHEKERINWDKATDKTKFYLSW